jgi:hypothetical protein
MKAKITVEVEVDLDAFRAGYPGENLTPAKVAEYLHADVTEALTDGAHADALGEIQGAVAYEQVPAKKGRKR